MRTGLQNCIHSFGRASHGRRAGGAASWKQSEAGQGSPRPTSVQRAVPSGHCPACPRGPGLAWDCPEFVKWQQGWWRFVSVPCGKALECSSHNITREEPGVRAQPGGGTVRLVPSGLLFLPWAHGTESDDLHLYDSRLDNGPNGVMNTLIRLKHCQHPTIFYPHPSTQGKKNFLNDSPNSDILLYSYS